MQKIITIFILSFLFLASCSWLFQEEDVLYHEVRVYPLELTESIAEFKVVYTGNNRDNFQLHTMLGDSKLPTPSPDVDGNYQVSITDLQGDTIYTLTLQTQEGVLETIPFRTFDETQPFSLFYFIDVSATNESLVQVTIMGQVTGAESHTLGPKGYHTAGEYMYVTGEPVIEIEGSATVVYQPGIYPGLEEISIESSSGTSTFSITYLSDKSYRDTNNHGCQGILTRDYFMASGEQLLYLPTTLYPAVPGQIFGTLITPEDWKDAVEFEAQGSGVFDFCFSVPPERAWTNNEALSTVRLAAYDPTVFDELIRNVDGVEVSVIFQESLGTRTAENVLDIYEEVAEIWGNNSPGDSRYSIFLIDDDRLIYGGEWTTGQGFSSGFGIEGEMLVHQIYHRWNGWQYGLPFNSELGGIVRNRGFWIEGWNEYFCDQVLFNLGFDPEHNTMSRFYDQYKQIRGTLDDQSLLEEPLDIPQSIYFKGAVYAYHLDQYIRENSNNTADLRNVVQKAWQGWLDTGIDLSYDLLTDYITDLLVNGKSGNEWVDAYLINNNTVILPEFEEL